MMGLGGWHGKGRWVLWFCIALWPVLPQIASADRIKDLGKFAGVRGNQLIGYGLVVGLDGSGDSSAYTSQTFKTFLSRLGVVLPDNITPKSANMAAVAVSAELPPFYKPGQTLDVTVSSIGSAKSLRGGTLLMTPLKAVDGQVYALAQGNLVVGGLGTEGKDGSQIRINIPVVGRIPGGAVVEMAAPNQMGVQPHLTLLLNQPDFTTARRVVDVIEAFMGKGSAGALDPSSIRIEAPTSPHQRVAFMAAIENLEVTPADRVAKIVVNSRTGTIVIGKNVVLGSAAVTHGGLIVTIAENTQTVQPPLGSRGVTAEEHHSGIQVTQPNSRMFLVDPLPTLEDLVRAVNEMGVAPGDLMAILDALKQAGALRAELEVI